MPPKRSRSAAYAHIDWRTVADKNLRLKVRWHTDDAWRQKMLSYRKDPSYRALENARRRARYAADPQYRQKRLNALRRNPVARARRNERQRYRYANDPALRAKVRIEAEKWARQNPELNKAAKKKYRLNNRAKIAQGRRAWYERTREAILAGQKRKYNEARLIVLNAYGNKCSCCGEDEPKRLTIQHILRDGRRHRKMGAIAHLRDIANRGFPKDRYTVFCMQCNWETRYGDPCTHKKAV